MKYMVLAAAATMVLGSCVSKKELVAAQQQLQECQDKGKSLGQKYYEAQLQLTEYKTKNMIAMLQAVGAAKKTLVVLPEVNDFVIKSCANIEGVKTTQWNTINVYDILNCDTLIVAKDAVAKIEEVYAR